MPCGPRSISTRSRSNIFGLTTVCANDVDEPDVIVDIGIFGVAGVGEDGTLLDFYEEEVRARQLIRENSRSTFLVLDRSKFHRNAYVRGGHISEATKVFCDARPPESIIDMLRDSGSKLVICGERSGA